MQQVTSMLGFLIELPDSSVEDVVMGKKIMAKNALRLAAASFWTEEMIQRLSKLDKDFKKQYDGVKSLLEVR